MVKLKLSADAFGDRFDIATLPLPRPATGYAVQMLDTDLLLNRRTGQFMPVRTPGLEASFESFDSAYAAAEHWIEAHGESLEDHRLAIVPVGYDPILERHVLIYGVLCGAP
ncbi:hypothetical protein [Azonexus sp. IMCC34839]|uniref:hypothetical protein n=1 Tax=Azonexus sp. IMCC34839 TaxID=3133695 RepID=UPI00399BCCE0